MLVHSDELEEKVCKTPEIEHLRLEIVSHFIFLWLKEVRKAYDNRNHSQQALPACEQASHDENHDCDRDCGNCESKFDVPRIHNDNDKLDGESKEEEEVEFQECNVDLMARVSTWTKFGVTARFTWYVR